MAKSSRLEIPGIDIRKLVVTIVGDTPLICNKFSDVKQGRIKDKQAGKPRGPRAPKDVEAEYQNSMYRMRDGGLGFPAGGIKKAAVDACRHIDGATMVKAKGSFYIFGDPDNLVQIEGEPEIFEHYVKLRDNADIRYRARFLKWSITLVIRYEKGDISEESILNLLERAGFHVGIGDWRPQKGGIHGMFRVARAG